MKGYEEAEKLDQLINKLGKKHSMKGNEREWLKFTRTLTSSLGIINTLALKSLGLETEQMSTGRMCPHSE